MPRKFPLTSVGRISEMNLTSMMDLTFLLLITFIITFPLMEQGIPVNLPKGTSESLPKEKSTTVTVDKAGSVYLDDARVTLDALRAELQRRVERNPACAVLLRADEELKYGRVVDVLKILRETKVAKMALVTQSDGR